MNQKIQSLIDGGFISIADVMEYATEHNNQIIADSYVDEYEDMWDESIHHVVNYEYVVVSTSYKLKETMVFTSDENGEITNWGDIACVKDGVEFWDNHNYVIRMLDDKYVMVKQLETGDDRIIHTLWKLV